MKVDSIHIHVTQESAGTHSTGNNRAPVLLRGEIMKLSVREVHFGFNPLFSYYEIITNFLFFTVQTCVLCNLHDGSCPFFYGDIARGAEHTESRLHLAISEALQESVLDE